MPRRPFIRPRFNPALPVVVAKPLQASGKFYQPGDPFPWKEMDVEERRIAQMYDMRQLRHLDQFDGPPPVPSKAAPSSNSDTAADGAATEPDPELMARKMPKLRALAEDIGAPKKSSKRDQVLAIMAVKEGAA